MLRPRVQLCHKTRRAEANVCVVSPHSYSKHKSPSPTTPPTTTQTNRSPQIISCQKNVAAIQWRAWAVGADQRVIKVLQCLRIHRSLTAHQPGNCSASATVARCLDFATRTHTISRLHLCCRADRTRCTQFPRLHLCCRADLSLLASGAVVFGVQRLVSACTSCRNQ